MSSKLAKLSKSAKSTKSSTKKYDVVYRQYISLADGRLDLLKCLAKSID